jgi:hypothetical protein
MDMKEIRAAITEDEFREIEHWRKNKAKTRRAFIREALADFIMKCKNEDRGLESIFVRSKHPKQTKLDLD